MKQHVGLAKKAITCALTLAMGLSGVYVPDVAWAQEQSAVPEWAVDDGHDERPEENPGDIFAQAALPAAYDMRDDGVVTPVKSQGNMMSCWTFGGVAAAETSILSANTTAFGGSYEDSHIDLSERHLAFFSLSPVSEADDPAQAGEGMHTFATTPNAAFDAGGASLFVTSLYSTGVGPVVEQAFPYRGVDENGESHTNLQLFDADPEGETEKWIASQLKEAGIDKSVEDYYKDQGKTLEEGIAENMEAARKAVEFNVCYSPAEDWSIPLVNDEGASNRCLQSGVLLKDGNVLPEYWADPNDQDAEPNPESVSSMKQEILNGHGVCLAFEASRDEKNECKTDDGGMRYAQYVPHKKPADHGICIVGWDDNYSASNFLQTPKGDGAWICKNSWGSTTDACEDDLGNVVNRVEYGYKNDEGEYTGYFYLSYYDKTIDKLETMDFTDSLGSEDGALAVAQHDYMPACGGFYVTDDSTDVVSTANVFDAEEPFEIRGVSTFTAEPNTRVTFAIYELNDGATTPTDGRLLYRTSQNFGYEGFHRLDLTQRPTVARGKKFSIVSTASTLNENGERIYRAAANQGYSEEYASANGAPFYSVAVVNEGESFISNGNTWQDWTQYRAEHNVESDGPVDNFSIKAYGTIVDDPAQDPAPGELRVTYAAHVAGHGWLPYVTDGETAGTTGESRRMEALKVKLEDAPVAGSIEYRAHLEGTGWEDSYVADDAMAGTTGEYRRVEAVQMRLTGEMADLYDVWYRVHSETYGWLGWARNDSPAGTTGLSKRAEAVEVKVLPKGSAAPGEEFGSFISSNGAAPEQQTSGHLVSAQAHTQTYGWVDPVYDGATAGTTGQFKRLEALSLELCDEAGPGSIEYLAHVQTYGWGDETYVADGAVAGTTGEFRHMEAVRIRLRGAVEAKYDVWYRVHSQTYGWLGWACNDEPAGTTGLSKRAEAVQVLLLPKGSPAPGATENHFQTV